jgi:RNA polymerase sigma-70 factor (ECF subfamily)
MADSLSLAFLVLLESLSPEQRAVLLLRDVFDYGYDEIAPIVGKTEANARQLAARARRHVEERRPRLETSREQRDELARRFLAAAEEGELGQLEALLAHDVELHGDGGGKAPALARALRGRSRVARTVIAWMRQGAKFGARLRVEEINGQPGAIVLDPAGNIVSVLALEIGDGRVRQIRGVVNPDKLAHLGTVADARALLRGNRPDLRSVAKRPPGP